MRKMMNFEESINAIFATISTSLTWLLGGWDIAVGVLVAFMTLDYISGLLKAYVNQEISSDTGLRGITRKCLILLVLIGAVLLDRLMNTETWIFRTLVCYFYVANEGISLLENAATLGLPIPERLKEALNQLKTEKKKQWKEE